MDRKWKMDVELPLFPLEIAAIRKSFWPLVRGGNRSVSQITFR